MFQKIKPEDLTINPFTAIGKEWMLISAGNSERYNMMTASWGGLGIFWGMNVSIVYIRPQRYTLEFINAQSYYALNFFQEAYRDALSYCGTYSGRDVDKMKTSGLTAQFDNLAPCFQEAHTVLICRKLHRMRLDPSGFIDQTLDQKFYPEEDYHEIFVGEIVDVLHKK